MSEKIQLFCIPYAGGMAGAFDELKKLLADEILVTPIEYAGHGTRKTEAFYQDFGELAGDVRNQMRELRRTDLPCALMGYSMGSISVYEILRRYGDEYSPKH
ncbi:MAG: thioesterase domain-containing protein, partial [Lachnospiraceae bacterium]|nr:thioesterase domain-containing protein [Lachnospiraceae bacterium]